MNKTRILNIIALVTNLALLVCGILGVYMLGNGTFMGAFSVDSLKYYTVLTALITFLGSALMIWANIVNIIKKRDCTPRLFYSIRYLSAVMSLLTFLTVVIFLRPTYLKETGVDILFAFEGGHLFLHFLCPIISIAQFIILEIEPKAKFSKTIEPFVVTLIYSIVIIAITFARISLISVEDAAAWAPYPFFRILPNLAEVYGEDFVKNIITAIVVIVISYVASCVVWLFNRIFHAILIGDEYVVEEKKKPTKGKNVEPVKKASFSNFVKSKVGFAGSSSVSNGPVYHISYHDRRLHTWKVKGENAGRALKVFSTQKEAIAFANAQIKKSGGSIRVHSMSGKIRKE